MLSNVMQRNLFQNIPTLLWNVPDCQSLACCLNSVNFYFINIEVLLIDFHQNLNESTSHGVLTVDHCIVSVQYSINISTIILTGSIIFKEIIFIDGDCCDDILQPFHYFSFLIYNSVKLSSRIVDEPYNWTLQ